MAEVRVIRSEFLASVSDVEAELRGECVPKSVDFMPSFRPLINLDHNATTSVRPEVIDEVARGMRDVPGNPGSRHAAGRTARRMLEQARERIAARLGATPDEVIFTSGGTESINTALHGLASKSRPLIAATAGEHPATEQTLRHLEASGQKRSVLPISSLGRLDEAAIDLLPWDEIGLATVLLAHNETGVVQDVRRLAAHCERHRIPWHVDAVQAVGKWPVNFRELGATALSLAAHKFQGPRGIGALLLKKDVRLVPLLQGGHQERGFRPGTEPVALAVGMALALELREAEREDWQRRIGALRDRLERGILEQCAPAQVLGDPVHRLPNTLNMAFPGCLGEALLVALDLEGVCCSTGSACASGSAEPAPVHLAMGLSPEVSRSSLRFSLGSENTEAEIVDAINRIAQVVHRIRKAR